MTDRTALTHGDDLPALPADNRAWFEAHLAAHGTPDHPVLPAFFGLVDRMRGVTAEASCKIDGDEVHPLRLNLLSVDVGGHARRLDVALSFLDEVAALPGVTLHRPHLDAICDAAFDRSRVVSLFTGVDLRPRLADSRVKVWLGLYRDPERIARALALHGPAGGVERLVVQGRLLVGFDHFLDRRAAVKVYPDFRARELEKVPEHRALLASVLSPRTLELVRACHWVHVSYDARRATPVVHFHAADPDDFVARFVDNAAARAVHERYRGQRLRNVCFSLSDAELAAGGPLRQLNVYYKR